MFFFFRLSGGPRKNPNIGVPRRFEMDLRFRSWRQIYRGMIMLMDLRMILISSGSCKNA